MSQGLRIAFGVFIFLLNADAYAARFALQLERCTRTNSDPSSIHECKSVASRDIDVDVNSVSRKPLLTGSEKRRMFRYEENIGGHQIAIGAFKPDPVRALTVMNVSLAENGKGQVDYNETSFYDDKSDNYLSLALRSTTQGEYYRVKLEQKHREIIKDPEVVDEFSSP